MAGSVDNVNLLEVPVQEVSAYGEDITTTTIVLFHCHWLSQPRTRPWCAAGVRERGGMVKTEGERERQKKKNRLSTCTIQYTRASNLDKSMWLIQHCLSVSGSNQSGIVSVDYHLASVGACEIWTALESLKRHRSQIDQNCAGVHMSAYGQELTRRQSPQAGFLIRYMGQPYAARAKSM